MEAEPIQPLPEGEFFVRQIAREEIASLCGLVLNRISASYDESPAMHNYDHRAYQVLRSVFGEALRDFGGTSQEPGPKDAA